MLQRLALITVSLTFIFAPPLSRADESKLLGPATCASSNCHGSVAPRKASPVLQNEYVTWQKHDAHSGAYRKLLSEDSKQIAKHLGIPAPEKSNDCLSCHAPGALSSEKHGEKFQVEDGVTCETCHGAASAWIKSHAEKGTTHFDNLANGMAEISSAKDQARLCLSCHYGDENRAVTHRLIGAGHPRLTFELDTFEAIMPRHWEVDDDYRARKGDYRPFEGWLTSQVHRAKQMLEHLRSPKTQGYFPELSLYNCSSCHHSLNREEWRKRDYHGRPGEVQLNVSSLRMLAVVTSAIDSKRGTLLSQAIAELERAGANGGVREAVDRLEKQLGEFDSTERPLQQKQLTALITFGAEAEYLPYEDAEQIAMGISAALADGLGERERIEPKLKLVYDTLKDPRDFHFEQFHEAMQRLSQKRR